MTVVGQKRERLLLLCSRAPDPLGGGERNKNLNLLRILSQYYDITLVCLNERPLSREESERLSKYVVELKIFVKPRWLCALKSLRALWNGRPLQVNYYDHSDVHSYVEEKFPTTDVAVAALIRTARYLESFKGPKFLDMGDSIALHYLRARKKSRSFFWGLIYAFEGKKLLNYEKQMVKVFSKTFLFNQSEVETFQNPGKIVWVPHGVKEELLSYDRKAPGYENVIAFLGKMDYQPNVQACLWFCKNVLPMLKPSTEFWILGVHPTAEVKELAQKYRGRVNVTGFLEDPYLILNSCRAVVAPMQTGGGIQNKILESMALGQTVITTPLGASALPDIRDNEEIIIRDDPKDFALAIEEQEALKERIRPNARRYIQKRFTWAAFGKTWRDVLSDNA